MKGKNADCDDKPPNALLANPFSPELLKLRSVTNIFAF